MADLKLSDKQVRVLAQALADAALDKMRLQGITDLDCRVPNVKVDLSGTKPIKSGDAIVLKPSIKMVVTKAKKEG